MELLNVEKTALTQQSQQSNVLMMAQEKKMALCETCGSFLIANDAAERTQSHVTGKQHVGYGMVRDFLSEYKVIAPFLKEKTQLFILYSLNKVEVDCANDEPIFLFRLQERRQRKMKDWQGRRKWKKERSRRRKNMKASIEVVHLIGTGTVIGIMEGSVIATGKEIVNMKGPMTGMAEGLVTETGVQIGSTVIPEMEGIGTENVTEAGHDLLLDPVTGAQQRVQFTNVRGL